MTSPETTELTLTASRQEAIEAIQSSLPKDAVVRGEDDGVGRFAGERVLMVVGDDRDRLMLFRGTWGAIKKRLDDPQLKVTFKERDGAVVAELQREPDKPITVGSRIADFLSQAVTVAAVVVAYHFVRKLPVDYAMTAAIAFGGALIWSLVAYFMPSKPDRSLDDMVKEALAPLKKKKKKSKPKAKAEDGAEKTTASAPSE